MAAELLNRFEAITVQDIWAKYGLSQIVLKGISCKLEAGSITMLLGKSGSGKTSLLRTLQGIMKPYKGKVVYSGNLRTAYIPQNLGLIRSESAFFNVMIGALSRIPLWRTLSGQYPKKIQDEARQWLQMLGLQDKLSRRVSTLSGGERQRVAIARAMMMQPDFIFADEFVSQLDEVSAREMLERISVFAAHGIGFLITTHDVAMACQVADRIWVIRDGQLCYDTDKERAEPLAILGAIR